MLALQQKLLHLHDQVLLCKLALRPILNLPNLAQIRLKLKPGPWQSLVKVESLDHDELLVKPFNRRYRRRSNCCLILLRRWRLRHKRRGFATRWNRSWGEALRTTCVRRDFLLNLLTGLRWLHNESGLMLVWRRGLLLREGLVLLSYGGAVQMRHNSRVGLELGWWLLMLLREIIWSERLAGCGTLKWCLRIEQVLMGLQFVWLRRLVRILRAHCGIVCLLLWCSSVL